jgi:ABC-type Fe3+-siderophore transport system permease subunit
VEKVPTVVMFQSLVVERNHLVNLVKAALSLMTVFAHHSVTVPTKWVMKCLLTLSLILCVVARMLLLDRLLTMLAILAPNKKIRQADAIQMLKTTSGSLWKDVSSSVMSKRLIADPLLKTMLLSTELSVMLVGDLMVLQPVVEVVKASGAQQMVRLLQLPPQNIVWEVVLAAVLVVVDLP